MKIFRFVANNSVLTLFFMLVLNAIIPISIQGQVKKAMNKVDSLRRIALPLVCIDTEGAVDPQYKEIYPPAGCEGASITDNDFVQGRMIISLLDSVLYDSGNYKSGESGMRIRVRGNTSTIFYSQKPYKLKLSKKADLLFRKDKKYKNKNWALLSTQMDGNLTFTMAGLQLSRLVGMSWEPETSFVNVVLNGRYLGLYNLIETIERSDSRIQTADNGFVIENDPYWWNEGDEYFKTTHQQSFLGYTFKYPDYEDMNMQRIQQIQSVMQSAEDVLWSDEDASQWFDYPSFARWILSHDILGTKDGLGSNMFYVMEDMDADGKALSPIKAGPLWDFGSMLWCDSADWSVPHTYPYTFLYALFKREAFVKEYIHLFESVKPTLMNSLQTYFDDFLANNGQAIEESIVLDNPDYAHVDKQVADMMASLSARMLTIERLLKRDYPTLGIETIKAKNHNSLEKRVSLLGRDFTNWQSQELPKGFYIERMSDGTVRKIKR